MLLISAENPPLHLYITCRSCLRTNEELTCRIYPNNRRGVSFDLSTDTTVHIDQISFRTSVAWGHVNHYDVIVLKAEVSHRHV